MTSRNQDEKCLRKKTKLFIQNLTLLGFQVEIMREKHSVFLSDEMFEKPNSNALRFLSHFLFTKLDEAQATALFQYCFPFNDKKSIQVFSTACLNWWKKITEENPIFNIPKIGPTQMKHASGPAIIQLMFLFSGYVVFETSKRLNSGDELGLLPPTYTVKSLHDLQMVALKSACHSESLDCLHNMQTSVHADESARKEAEILIPEYRENWKKRKALFEKRQRLLKKLGEALSPRSSNCTPSRRHLHPASSDKCGRIQKSITPLLKNVRAMWDSLESFIETTCDQRAIVKSVLKMKGDNSSELNASDLAPKVSAILLQQRTSEIHERVGSGLYEAGQLSLISLVNLFNLYLQVMLEKLHEVGVPNLEGSLLYVNAQTDIHSRNLNDVKFIIESANQKIPKLEEVVKDLKTSIDAIYDSCRPAESDRTCVEGKLPVTHGLLPQTPPFRFAPQEWKSPELSLDDGRLVGNQFKASPSIRPIPLKNENYERENLSESYKENIPGIIQGSLEDTRLQRPINSKLQANISSKNPPTIIKPTLNPEEHTRLRCSNQTTNSLPSTPASRTLHTTIQKIISRTPDAVQTLIDQIVDFTMEDMTPPKGKPSHASLTPGSAIPPTLKKAIKQFESGVELDSSQRSRENEDVFENIDISNARSLWDTSMPFSLTDPMDPILSEEEEVPLSHTDGGVPVGNLIDFS